MPRSHWPRSQPAVAEGQLAPGEAAEMAKLVELFVRAIEAGDLERRLRVLEESAAIQR